MKLIRDRTPDLERGSTRLVRDDVEKELLLRMKLMEEAAEVAAATSEEEFFMELGDLYETMQSLIRLRENRSFQEVIWAAEEKRIRKGGFDKGVVLLHDTLENKRGTV